MKFRWCIEQAHPVLAGQLARSHKTSPLLAQCLINRGIQHDDSVPLFLEPRLKQLSDPFLLGGMEACVRRLLKARELSEPLVIFGDYDVDGVTSTAMLLEVFTALGIKAAYYLPHRRDEGYGLTKDALASCLQKHPCKLVLAVDCGSNAVEPISALAARGIEALVLDHHQASDPLPPALALVNPHAHKSSEGAAPFTELCSAGLAFKLAHALVKRGRQTGLAAAEAYDVRQLLDLAALGTIADVVPLIRENRVLVSAGLERLCSTTRPGLVALKQVAQCPMKVGVHDVGFQLAPRLNAAGRLETAADALELLRASTQIESLAIAHRLNTQNAERQTIERGIVEAVLSRVRAGFSPERDWVIVEGDMSWHIGVVGIVASRVLQKFNRPTIILGGDGGNLRGSGRSVPGFDLAAALRRCGDLLVRHGGHAMAAGITIKPENLVEFRLRLNEEAMKIAAGELTVTPLRIDAEIGLDEISAHSLALLDKLRPFGMGNPSPSFFSRGLTHQRPLQRMGAEKQHVKMWVTDGAVTHEAVWWGAGEGSLPVGRFDLAFEATMNSFNGRSAPQLKVLDWRPSDAANGTAQLGI